MSGGQIVALLFAILLLLPGACFLRIGINEAINEADIVGAVILSVAGLLFWVAFRRRPPGQGGSPDAPPS